MMLAGSTPRVYNKRLPEPETVFVIDFFSGCGGMSYGFATTRQSHLAFKVLAGIDIDGVALQTFERNTGAAGVRADIAKIGADPAILQRLIPNWDPETMRPLVFLGCPPCQGFSAMRKGDDRDDERNSLIMAFAQITAHYRPDVVVMENVPEIIKGKFSHYFSGASKLLKRSGYALRHDVLDLSLYGVPQRRRRAVIFGSLTDEIEMPMPIFSQKQALTVRHAIRHLRPLEANEIDPYDPIHRAPNHTSRLVTMFKAIPSNGGDRRSLPTGLRLKSHLKLDRGNTPGFTDVYGRLRWDTPSVTITAKSRSASSGRFLHPEQHRNISVREAAILQGFPQSFTFSGSPSQQYRHIGEAVPPLFARHIAWQILEHFRPRPATAEAVLARIRKTKARSRVSELTLVDGFCGGGGIALGFKAAGIDTSFAFDIDEAAVQTFQSNLGPNVEIADILDPGLSRRLDKIVGSRPYCIAGGPPCQGFSHQRRGDANDPRNQLVLRFADLIEQLKNPPKAIIVENVTDLDNPRGRHVLSELLDRLHKLNYTSFRHDLNSADYGVPQLRRRIIIVAVPNKAAMYYKGPIPLSANHWLTVGDALCGLPEPSNTDSTPTPFANHILSREGDVNRRRISFVDMGAARDSIPTDLQLPCHTKNYRGHFDVYGRLDWFSQARTITGGFDSFTRGEYGHPFQHRSITPREAARIQGFPDWFEFKGSRSSVRRQIGNAVPPPLAYAVAKAVIFALRKAGDL